METKKLNFWDCMGFCIGQIVGSGVFVLTAIVIGLTGHGAPYGYFLAAIISLISLIPMATLSSSMPATGGSYVYAKKLLGPRIAFVFLLMFILQQVLVSTFAIGFASYVGVIFPSVNQTVVAVGALTAAVIVNLIGLKTSAKVQKVMVSLLLISLFIYIVFGLPKVDWSALEFSASNIMPHGLKNFLQGATLLSFACGGASFLAENGGEIENPGKNIPKAMILSTAIVAIFYAFVGIVAACVLPLDKVAGVNISVVAKEVFPAPVYLFFVIGGAWFALLTTLNGTLSWTTRSLQRAAMDGWLPEICAKENKNGTPVLLLFFFFIVGLIPILTGMDTTDISNMGTGCSKLTGLFTICACWRLPSLFPEAYEAAVKEAKIDVVGRPDPEVVSMSEADGVVLKVKVAVKPEVELGEYAGLTVTKEAKNVNEADVDAEVKRMQDRNGRLLTREGAAENGDTVDIDFEGFVDGKAFEGGKAEHYSLVLGSGSFIPGFEDQVVGHSAGEEFDVNVKFPEEYGAAELAGKDATFKIKLHEVKYKELPALDDDFAKDVSEYDTLDELKDSIRNNIKTNLDKQAEQKVENDLMDQVISNMKADIPDAMVDSRIDELVQDFEYRISQQGLKLADYLKYMGMNIEQFRAQFKEQADKQVKMRLAMEAIVAKEGITASDEEFEEEVKRIADAYKMEADKVKSIVDAAAVKADLAINKAIDFVKEKANVVPAEPKEEEKQD